jgi:glycosyltransferase involved in cell wall biosynthesis
VLFKDGFNLELLNEKEKVSVIDNLPHPRFLYIGGINRKIQVQALTFLAERYQTGSVILVGPRSEDLIIPEHNNIYIYPPCGRYGELAGFFKDSDVGLIPYLPDKYSGAMHPAKLNEYLVFGLPVVAAATPELTRLASSWGEGFFYLYDTPDKLRKAAEKALSDDNEELREKRRTLTLKNTWDRRIEELCKIINAQFLN